MRLVDLKMSLFDFRIGDQYFKVTTIKAYPTYGGFLDGDLKYVTNQIISRLGQLPGPGTVYFLRSDKITTRNDSEPLPAYRYEFEIILFNGDCLSLVYLSDSGLSNLESELIEELTKVDIAKLIQDYAKEFDY